MKWASGNISLQQVKAMIPLPNSLCPWRTLLSSCMVLQGQLFGDLDKAGAEGAKREVPIEGGNSQSLL